jgi:hypothetical protein
MVQKKSNIAAAVVAFRANHGTDSVDDALSNESYLVPKIVKDMGQLIGLWSDSIVADWDKDTFKAELLDAYRELAATTAILLDLYSVQQISDEAVVSVGHRLAASVQPLVSLHSRVDHLYRAFLQDESEHVLDDVQKLWAALEFRSEGITGLPFAQVLKDS